MLEDWLPSVPDKRFSDEIWEIPSGFSGRTYQHISNLSCPAGMHPEKGVDRLLVSADGRLSLVPSACVGLLVEFDLLPDDLMRESAGR